MDQPAQMQMTPPAATMAVTPEGTEMKEKSIVAVEIMNGIVFAVILLLFGLVWGVFASVTFAGV